MGAMKIFFPALFLLIAFAAAAAYDANGVALGGSESDVKKNFPGIYCKPLEWSSKAADRRCDDAKISIGGIEGRITFYLRKGVVQAFDLRFDTKDLDRLTTLLKKRYGKPLSEAKESIQPEGKPVTETYKALWETGKDRAVLIVPLDKKRGQLTVSRGDWEDEIYKVR
jgi:hypothetical protein